MGVVHSQGSTATSFSSAIPASLRANVASMLNRSSSKNSTNLQAANPDEDSASPGIMPGAVIENSSPNQTVCYGKPFLLRWEPQKQTLLGKITANALASLPSMMNRSTSSCTTNESAMMPSAGPGAPASSTSDGLRRKSKWVQRQGSSSASGLNQCSSSLLTKTRKIPPKTSRFWCANEASRECFIGEVAQTSLLTFHAQNANAVNIRGTTAPLVSVPDESVITIYANVGAGRYLTYEYVSGMLRFVSSPQDVRSSDATARACEFFVRKVGDAPFASLERNRISSCSQTTGEKPLLVFGELVTLESVALPGHFLVVKLPSASSHKMRKNLSKRGKRSSQWNNNNNQQQQAEEENREEEEEEAIKAGTPHLTLVSSAERASKFALHSPTLRELVQLNAGNNAAAAAAANNNGTSSADFLTLPDHPDANSFLNSNGDDDFQLAETRAAAEREKQWMQAIAQRLPIDLAKRIFEFHRDWTRTARLVSKSWMTQAERCIKRVRVNGEFCSLETDEERAALVTFVRRCPNLEVLTLRNVMMLSDEDVAKITDNQNMRGLILGGCRRLSDRSTLDIARKLHNLRHLNMAFTNITDESLRIVAENMQQIRELNLYNCPRVTVEGINRSADNPNGLNNLEHMNLRGTVVEGHLVQDFKRKRPIVVVLTGPASTDSIWG